MSALVSLPDRDIGAEVVSPLVQAAHVQLPANATALAFAADNRSLAVALGDGSVSLVTRSALGGWGQINRPCHRVAAVAVASLGPQIVTASQDGAVRLVDPEVQVAPEPLYHAADHWIEALAVHEASAAIAIAAGREVAMVRADGQCTGTASLAETPTGPDFAPDAPVFVAEVACGEADCPDTETVIAVLEAGGRREFRIAKAVSAVTGADIVAARP